jgi:hypothetical protein
MAESYILREVDAAGDRVATHQTTDVTPVEVPSSILVTDENEAMIGQQTKDNSIPVVLATNTDALDVDASIDTVGSVVDANNSTTTPLTGAAVFTGTGTDLLGYSAVTCTLYANVPSAPNGMTFQFSTDGTNWDDVYQFTMGAGDTRRFQFPICARYFRIVYTNDASPQIAFRVQTLLHTANQLTSIHRLAEDMSSDRSAQVVKAALFAQKAGSGDLTLIDATAAGNLKVSIEEVDADIPITLDGETVDVSDRAARDLGKVDIAGIDAIGPAAGQATKANSLPVTLASDEDDVLVKPFAGIVEAGTVELIGINEQVDTDDYCASESVALGAAHSGEIVSVLLTTTEDDTGAILEPAGWLYFFDANPNTISGGVVMNVGARAFMLGRIKVEAADWDKDANGGSAYIFNQLVFFHSVSTLYVAFKLTSAVSFNDAAGDDEQLELNFWYRRDS